MDGYLSKYTEGHSLELYFEKEDPGLKNNIAEKYKDTAAKHKRFTEAFIQQYNNNIISNSTHP